MRKLHLATLLLASISLGACSTIWKPPEISYDDTPRQAVLQPDPPRPVQIVELPKLLPLPGQLKPIPGAKTAPPEAADPHTRVEQANGAARVQPTQAGYLNAIQVYPFAEGALDLPLFYHPAAIRASAGFTPCGAGGATCDRRS
jgi:hypothetical protein